MAIFDQDITLDHLPKDMRDLYEILIEIDKVLHTENRLLSEERALLERHKGLLASYRDRVSDERMLLLLSSLEDVVQELSRAHERFQWIEGQLRGFEKQLREKSAVDWEGGPMLDFLNRFEDQMHLEEAEMFDEELLIERFKNIIEHEAQPLSPEEQAELQGMLDFLVEHAKRVFRLQKLLLDTIGLLQD